MINIFLTNRFENSNILDQLKTNYAKGGKHLLVVPDRFTLAYEKAVLDYLNILGSFDIEVVSFSRLANKTLQSNAKIIDTQTEIMLLRKVIEENKSKLVRFRNASNYVGFAQEIGTAISQIRNSGVSIDNLIAIVDKLPNKIATKTQDIITIYYEYLKLLKENYYDNTSKLSALADNIRNLQLENYHLYVTDFMTMSKLELDILQGLVNECKSSSICLLDSKDANAHIFPQSLKKNILNICDTSGHIVNIARIDTHLTPAMSIMSKYLFSYKTPPTCPNMEGVELYCSTNKKQEIMACISKIRNLVSEGVRYKEIAIACADESNYLQELSSKLTQAKVPHYADIKTPLISQPMSKFVMSLLQCHSNNNRRGDFFELASCINLNEDKNNLFAFQNYCYKYGIEYTRFCKPFSIGEESEIEIAEGIRKITYKALSALDNVPLNVGSYCKAIHKALELIDYKSLSEQYSQSLEEKAMAVQANIVKQSYKKVLDIIDQCNAIMGGQNMELSRFTSIILSCIASVEISTAPMFVDSIYIGDCNQSRYENIKYLFVIGTNADNFPSLHSDSGIVAEKESSQWAKFGVIVEPNAMQMNLKEKCVLLQALLKPQNKLIISYSMRDNTGAEQQISDTIKYISQLLNVEIKSIAMATPMWEIEEYLECINCPSDALEMLLDMTSRHNSGITKLSDKELQLADALYEISCNTYGGHYVDTLVTNGKKNYNIGSTYGLAWKNNYTSPSQLEKYFNCPFKHFIDYILRAKRQEKSGLEMNDIGTVLHAMAEKYFSCNDWDKLTEQEIYPRCEQLFESLKADDKKMQIMLMQKNGEIVAKTMLNRSYYMLKILSEKTKKSKFRPQFLEVKFGFDENGFAPITLEAKNAKVKLRGVIDRIDMYENKFITIDYKSKASIDFKPINILVGERCQMFIYVDAIMQNKQFIPAGVAYMLMTDKMIKKEDANKQFKYVGYVDADESNCSDFDEELNNNIECESNLYPVKIRPYAKTSICQGELMNKSTLEDMSIYTHKLCEKAVGEIEEGYIGASPIILPNSRSTPCTYCEYGVICGHKQVDKERCVNKVDIEELKLVGEKANGKI